DMSDEGFAPLHAFKRELQEQAALAVGQADGFAGMHRQRQRVGAVGDVKLDQLCVAIEVDGALARERRHRRVYEAWLELGQGSCSGERNHQPCGSVPRMPSRSSSAWT